ncbi:MAG TPA: PIG-L family deacetylase [Lentisphaeria bacterium]|nr:MAG: GlcNAc-PI de-N-acetylase [Lentisphaerae bacterium GWF2_49_21]HBC87930.1 PIG-L family deacetylase [Lentisphaeria bacterium]
MKLKSKKADIFVPNGSSESEALKRTTHLSIAAHQDDTEIFAYNGIAECFGRSDKWFSSVIVTDGAGSPRSGVYKDYTDEQMKEIRISEQRKAASIGDYSIQIQLAYPSSAVKNPAAKEVSDDIFAILAETKPQVVYLHNPADKHDTHVACVIRAIEALRRLPEKDRPAKVYGCEVWRNLDWLCDDEKAVLPASDYKNVAGALLGVFDSQITGGKRYDLAAIGRRLANATFFASHETDECDSLIFAMDLTGLVKNAKLSIADFTVDAIERFRNDVKSRINKFS